MSVFLYNIFLALYKAAIRISSLTDPKAKKWIRGRKDIFKKLEEAIPADQKIVWMHCASLGEFEQGRPVLEKLKAQYPGYRFLLTFFSPSGYDAQKNYKGADWVFYLPMDGARNAKRFLEIVHPSLVIFVKYEFWYYYLKKVKYRNIPLLLISAQFRKDMSFFKWYGGLQRKILSRFDHLFVQNSSSKKLLDDIGLADITSISGDTRFDRVVEIATSSGPLPLIEGFIADHKCLVAGSTWGNDEDLLKKAAGFLHSEKIKLIIAPHEIDSGHISELRSMFPESLLYSSIQSSTSYENTDVLIIDNIGMLSRLYRYAWCNYVGGGHNKSGVHNVLEAAVYGKPVLYGPNYEFYQEATGLLNAGGAFVVDNEGRFIEILKHFNANSTLYKEAGQRAGDFVAANSGAVKHINDIIQEKRLLTS